MSTAIRMDMRMTTNTDMGIITEGEIRRHQ